MRSWLQSTAPETFNLFHFILFRNKTSLKVWPSPRYLISNQSLLRSRWNHLVYSAWRRLRGDLIAVHNFLMRRRGRHWSLFYDDQWQELRGTGTGSPELEHATKPVWVQEVFGQYSQALGVILEVYWRGLGVELNDHDESRPIQFIL